MKIIKVSSCNHCNYALIDSKGKVYCDELQIDVCIYDTTGLFIHRDCPLSDICDCTEFQSCERCAKKTKWINIEVEKPVFGKRYWIMDKNNNIEMADFEGHSEKGYGFFKFNTMDLSDMDVVMFAEIKPPEPPK